MYLKIKLRQLFPLIFKNQSIYTCVDIKKSWGIDWMLHKDEQKLIYHSNVI